MKGEIYVMKILKRILPVFLSAVIIFGCFGGLEICASAAGKITRTTGYGQDGTAIVTLTPADEDNYITYTVDGTAPKTGSEKYTEEILVAEQTFFRAAEFTPEGKRVSGIKFTVKPRVAPVQLFAEKDGDFIKIKLYTETLGAKIYYTTDGTAPTAESKLYLNQFLVLDNTKIRAVAIKKDYTNSQRISRTITINSVKSAPEEDNADKEENNTAEDEDKPVTSVAKDKDELTLEKIDYHSTRMADSGYAYVTLTPQKTGSKIYYTTDGSKPTTESKLYKSRIKYTEPGVLRAIEYNSKGEKIGALNVTIKTRCAPVEMVSTALTGRTSTIKMSTETPGASIYYTLDGSIPDEIDGILYEGPITLSLTEKIRAVAIKEGPYVDGKMTELYAMEVPFKYENPKPNDPVYKEMADLVNDYRAKNGLTPLYFDEKITEAANIRAYELSVINGDKRPNLMSYTTVFSEVGVSVLLSSEIKCLYAGSAEAAVKSFIATDKDTGYLISTNHNYDSIGAGHYTDKKGCEYWVILIADSKSR